MMDDFYYVVAYWTSMVGALLMVVIDIQCNAILARAWDILFS